MGDSSPQAHWEQLNEIIIPSTIGKICRSHCRQFTVNGKLQNTKVWKSKWFRVSTAANLKSGSECVGVSSWESGFEKPDNSWTHVGRHGLHRGAPCMMQGWTTTRWTSEKGL